MLTSEVKNNIMRNANNRELNSKVMTGDHVVTTFERERIILPYDNTKRQLRRKLSRTVATKIVNTITRRVNKETKIIGLENLKGFRDSAIITGNHYSPFDSTVIRHLTNKIGKKSKLTIVVAESNVFMKGKLGWLLKNLNTMPFTNELKYLEGNFNPAIKQHLDQNHVILFYPEQEMWPGYTKPRALKPGAYHYACKYGVPIIPTFTTMERTSKKIIYTLNVFPLIYPNPLKSLKENKEAMMKLDYDYKKNCYETFYKKRLTYDFSESDLIF